MSYFIEKKELRKEVGKRERETQSDKVEFMDNLQKIKGWLHDFSLN